MLTWINSPPCGSDRYLLVDRDGVINVDDDAHIKTVDDYGFYAEALEALAWLKARRVGVIVISNQSGLNRGIIAWDDFWAIHEWMVRGIREAGGDLLAAYYCPHRPDEACSCRKPAPGMILAACNTYPIIPQTTYMIGDRTSDLLAAENAGCRGVLLDRSAGGTELAPFEVEGAGGSFDRFPGLLEAVHSIFSD